ncbi:calcium-transporting ATPase 5, plasma membrane-type isoform X2 [Zea mays]|uniref:P-type Ca(2+) transporter n=1 Tax=Zea mays TaxID=4577 RepID=A0A1D6H240_MAIZE|nr:calcium-transporting ATPase 5, plasma membrane-type isoform X2 [Zea mays]AQK68941.1 Calcium-transporting ATPase 9 plasma membrane-type [Zea mays]|eukprot:XP_008645304.1 calcium-transporting ATPase 5, plasma membrane-type isoform X2 [Zea mays]
MAGGQAPEASPGRYQRRRDEIDDDDCADVLGIDVRGPDADPFDIPAKRAPVERLRRWRQAALVLNASRRFRYTLDLKKEEEKEQIRRKIRAHAQVIRAALLFKEAGEKQTHETELPEILPRDFGIGEEQLTVMTRDHNYSALQEYGGVIGLANLLKTNLEKGIHGDEADLSCRANAFGPNRYPRKKGRSFWVFLWEACQDMTLVILIIAAVISLVLGIATEGTKEGWYDGTSIAFAVFLVIVVTAVSDYKQSLQFQHLNEEKQNIQVEVIRGGRRIQVSIFDIVVGDIVALKIGDQVSADGVVISGHSLAIDESSMTGESKIVMKDQKSPFLMAGSKVADGYGTMLVTAVGLNTEWGLLMASISEDNNEETPLQVRLNGVATFIGIAGLSVAAMVLVVLFARYFTGHTTDSDGSVQFVKRHTSVKSAIFGSIKILTVAVTIVVVAVPEGLPLAVTLTLAYSMRKMMADKALVRRLSACETMGSATTICSDKTGTLTLNQMTVMQSIVGEVKLQPPANVDKLSSTVASLLLEGIAQNTSGSVFEAQDGSVEVTGSPTEKAILSWGLDLRMKFAEERSRSSIIHVSPFNSEKKRAGVAVVARDSNVHVHWKGAAEIVLALCTSWLNVDGSTHEMTPDKDPCRPEVRDAVELCKKAGVKVRMVTGDNLKTAKAIALECGILDDSEASAQAIIEGRVFRAYDDTERENVADKISVMARSSPNDKLLLVKALKKIGHVVAVTGDGTNDAPALHEADIGLSMGIQGTEVAKESSDIIILDDNFSSVVKVVRWGRSVYANIQKFIQFQLTVNVAALVINVVAAVSSGNVPLNAVQLLWVNLIMDTLGALALATEPPTDQLMRRPPVGRREPLVTNIMWRNLFIQAVFQVAVLLTLNFRGRDLLHLTHDTLGHSSKVKNTLIFNTFVLCQVFNEVNSRKPEELNIFSGVSRNHLFLAVVSITVVMQVIIIEFLGKFTSTVRLNWKLWLVSVVIAFLSWPLAFVGKFIPVPRTELKDLIVRCWPKRGESAAQQTQDDRMEVPV